MPTLPPAIKSNLIKQAAQMSIQQLVDVITKYENVTSEDFKDILSENNYEELLDTTTIRDPHEMEAWCSIKDMDIQNISSQELSNLINNIDCYLNRFGSLPNGHSDKAILLRQKADNLRIEKQKEEEREEDEKRRLEEENTWRELTDFNRSDSSQLPILERKIDNYIARYSHVLPNHIQDVNKLKETIIREREILKEAEVWGKLNKSNYDALLGYIYQYPKTIHFDEIDDLMWNLVSIPVNIGKISRFLGEMTRSRHLNEASNIFHAYASWEPVKNNHNLLEVHLYIQNYSSSPLIDEARSLYYKLKEEEIKKMQDNPANYDSKNLLDLLEKEAIREYEIIDAGVVTEKTLAVLKENVRGALEPVEQRSNNYLTASTNCTDIYFFGIPSTGKTCLLMGLVGANGNGYNLQMRRGSGGDYASDLSAYFDAGITPGSTFGTFVTVVNGTIRERKKDVTIDHPVNLIEMSGEEFAKRIADGQATSFEEMGTGATKLLCNDNRKVFYIIIDPTTDIVEFKFIEDIKDQEGNVVEQRIRKKRVSQHNTLTKLTSLFELPENQNIMSRVDAIHFVVTKADTFRDNRNSQIRDLLYDRYVAPVSQLNEYCRSTRRINYSTNYKVKAFPFSLGKFYVGDIFEFNKTDTLELIEAIKMVTKGKKEKGWWDRVVEILNN